MTRPIRSHVHVRVEAPREFVWERLVNLDLQPAWMTGATEVELVESERLEVGARLRVPMKMLALKYTDLMKVIAFDPPRRWEVEHTGTIRGRGEITLVEDGPEATIVYWTEEFEAPLGIVGEFVLTAVQPLFRRRFADDLDKFSRVLESEARHDKTF